MRRGQPCEGLRRASQVKCRRWPLPEMRMGEEFMGPRRVNVARVKGGGRVTTLP